VNFPSFGGSKGMETFKVLLFFQFLSLQQLPYVLVKLFIVERALLNRQNEVIFNFYDLCYHSFVDLMNLEHLLTGLVL
jgi:hypothetical protein